MKRKGSKSDLPPIAASATTKKLKTSPSSSPVLTGATSPSSSSSPSSEPPPIPSLSEKPHSEDDVRILQYQNRHLYFHLREKDRRLTVAERRERELEARCGRWQQQLSLLLSTWEEVIGDVLLCARRVGAEEVPAPSHAGQGQSKPHSAIARLLSGPSEGKDDPADSDGDPADDDDVDAAQTEVDHVLHARSSYARDLLTALTAHVTGLREENAALRSLARGEAKEGADVFLLWEKNEELSKKVEGLNVAVADAMTDARDVRLRAEQLHHALIFHEEQRRAADDDRLSLEADLLKAQRKVDKLEKDRELAIKKLKDDASKAAAASTEQSAASSSSSSTTAPSAPSSSALQYDEMVDRSALEALEEEKRELQQRLTEASARADRRSQELAKMRAELHRREVEVAALRCEGVAEEGVKDSVWYKVAAQELQARKDECEVLRVMVDKYAREMQERDAAWHKEKDALQREAERLSRAWQEKEDRLSQDLDRLSRAQTRAERDKEEAIARYDALAEKPAEERKRVDEERRRFDEAMERTIREQDAELRAFREQQQQQQQHDLSVHKWVVKCIKLQRRIDEGDGADALSDSSAASSISSLQAQVASLQQQLAALTADPELVATLTDTNAALMSELDDLATAHSELSEQHSRLLLSFAELQRDRSQLYSDKLKYKTMETLVRAKCSAHEQTITALGRETAAAQEHVKALEQVKAAQDDSARKHDALKAAMEKRVMDAQALIFSTRAELARVKGGAPGAGEGLQGAREAPRGQPAAPAGDGQEVQQRQGVLHGADDAAQAAAGQAPRTAAAHAAAAR